MTLFCSLFVDYEQTNVEVAIKWALTTRWGLPMPMGWTPTTRQSPTSWQALPTQLWPDATWVCQGRVGKTWLSGASAKNKPEGKLSCLDASLGYMTFFFFSPLCPWCTCRWSVTRAQKCIFLVSLLSSMVERLSVAVTILGLRNQ